jgi:hypothetical protein
MTILARLSATAALALSLHANTILVNPPTEAALRTNLQASLLTAPSASDNPLPGDDQPRLTMETTAAPKPMSNAPEQGGGVMLAAGFGMLLLGLRHRRT